MKIIKNDLSYEISSSNDPIYDENRKNQFMGVFNKIFQDLFFPPLNIDIEQITHK